MARGGGTAVPEAREFELAWDEAAHDESSRKNGAARGSLFDFDPGYTDDEDDEYGLDDEDDAYDVVDVDSRVHRVGQNAMARASNLRI